jgi:hypothetical protein
MTLSTRVYLQMARASAAVLGTHELVESVWVRRSVAAGEVAFGRSDIDLAVAMRSVPESSRELMSLMNRYRAVRTAFPLLGECLVYDSLDLRTWWSTDTYRASIDRRASVLLRGEETPIPVLPVEREHAAHRCAFWLEQYLPSASRAGNVRNMRKFAVEMWNAYATAIGIIAEPAIRRSEAEQLWRSQRDAAPGELGSLTVCFGILKELHDALLPPCELLLSRPMVVSTRWPPGFQQRTMVLIPSAESELPAEARRPDALIFTPEALRVYLEFVNPFAACTLPLDAGMGTVSRDAWLRACKREGASFRTRLHGFVSNDTQGAVGRIASVREALEWLSKGQPPPAMGADNVNRILATPKSVGRYYREIYPRLREECTELWAALDGLAVSTSCTSAASSVSPMRSQS